MNTFKTQAGKDEILRKYDALLGSLTIPHERLNIGTRHGNTFVIAAGRADAPPMILLHGSSMNSVMWVSDIKKYYEHYRVYALDMPGEPGLSTERQLPFNTSDYTDWLLDVFDALHIERAIIIGTSLGGWLGAKFAIAHPTKVEKLVLMCPAGIGTQHKSFLFIALFFLLFGEAGSKKLFKIINGHDNIPEEILDFQTSIGKHFNTRKEPVPLFTDDELRKLNMPVIVFVGAKDIILRSEETKARLNRVCPDVIVNLLPEAGHSLVNLTDKTVPFLEG